MPFKNFKETFLNIQIKLAEQEGFIGFDKSEKVLNDLLNASD